MRVEIRRVPVKLELKLPHILFVHDWSMRLTFYAFPLASTMADWVKHPVKNAYTQGFEINPQLKDFLNTKEALQYRIAVNSMTKLHIVGVYSNTQI